MRSHGGQIIPIKKPVELLPVKRQDIARQIIRPFEAFALQPLLPHAETGAFPIKYLDLVTLAIDEHEQLPAKWITDQLLFHQNGKAVYALAEVDRIAAQPDNVEIIGRAHNGRRSAATSSAVRAVASKSLGASMLTPLAN